MAVTKPFKKPDEETMQTAMVLQQLKDVLTQQKSNVVVIHAETTNDYYWAMFDPLDEEQWFDVDYGDIREMPLFATGIADLKQLVLELLQDRGVVKRLKVNSSQEDPLDMGWKDYIVTNSFEVELNLTKFLKYYDKYTSAAKPALTYYLNTIDSKNTPSSSDSVPQEDVRQITSAKPRVELGSYDVANGILTIAGRQVQIIKQPNQRGKLREGKQARLMRLLFNDVNSDFGTATMRSVLSVRTADFSPKHRKLVKSYASEINAKLEQETAVKEFLLTNQFVVVINELYLK